MEMGWSYSQGEPERGSRRVEGGPGCDGTKASDSISRKNWNGQLKGRQQSQETKEAAVQHRVQKADHDDDLKIVPFFAINNIF